MIRTVLFDIDDTLYDYDHANLRAVEALDAYVQRQFGWESGAFMRENAAWMRTIHGQVGDVSASHNRLIRFQNMLEAHRLPLFPHALRMHALYWDTLLDAAVVSPGARDTFLELRKRGLRIGIGTDMTARIQFRKLERMDLLDLVDFIVTSEEAGAEKPSPRLFELCVKKAECLPEECLFVGDSLERDYHGALAAGLQALWFDPPGGTFRGGDPGSEQVRKVSALPHILEYV